MHRVHRAEQRRGGWQRRKPVTVKTQAGLCARSIRGNYNSLFLKAPISRATAQYFPLSRAETCSFRIGYVMFEGSLSVTHLEHMLVAMHPNSGPAARCAGASERRA